MSALHLRSRILSSLGVSAVLFIGLFLCALAIGQERNESKYGSEFNLHLGTFLPDQIEGVEEILPFWGARFSYPFKGGAAEIGGMNAHAEGVDYTLMDLSFRGDLSPLPDITAAFYGGPTFHYYRPEGETSRKTSWGGHAGVGLMYLIADTMWFRTDMKFNMHPGVGLYIGFGLTLRSSGGGDSGAR